MSSSPGVNDRSKRAWAVLLVVLVIEVCGGLALLVSMIGDMLAAGDEPMGQRLSIFLAAVLSFVWVGVTLLAALKLRASWVRASAITIHVLIFAAATGILQLDLADTGIGWALVVLALVGFFAALAARPVVVDEQHAARNE